MRQPRWTIYEAAILLDGYLELNEKNLPKMRIVKRISDELRQMAVNSGMVIDEVFRNENGISYQIQSMDSAYAGHKIYIPATNLFSEIVEIYRNNKKQYETILREAKRMIMHSHLNRDSFLTWSASDASVKGSKWIENNLLVVESFGIKTEIISESIFDISDVEILDLLFRSISRSKPFQIINKKIYKYILQDLQIYRNYLSSHADDSNITEEEVNDAIGKRTESAKLVSDNLQVNFLNIGDLSYTKPTGYSYNSKSAVCTKWKQIYVGVLSDLCGDFFDKFQAIVDNESPLLDSPLVYSAQRAEYFHSPMDIGNGLFVEINYSSTMLVNNIKRFLDLCGVAYGHVTITYKKQDDFSEQSYAQNSTVSTQSETAYSKELLDAAETIISTCFVNGMRKNAVIAKKKFLNAYLDLMGSELPESVDIDNLATRVGFEYSEKIYAISEENKVQIKTLIRTAFETGNHVVFYEEIYKQNANLMTEAGIFSSDLLKIVLKQMFPQFSYKRSYFSENDAETLDMDIMACYESKLLLSYDEIKSMLPYADMSQIRSICSRNDRFVWAKEETYALAEKFLLSEDDINESKHVIADDISKQGFSVFQRILASASVELNPSVPEVALKEAIYSLHISTDYERKHSIITLPGASFSPSAVMNEYCNDLKEVTLDELYKYEDGLTSKTSYSLGAAYSTMIRVDKERFVSKDSLSLDVAAIDSVLALFVRDEIIPLKRVNSFTSFPEVKIHGNSKIAGAMRFSAHGKN